MNDKNVITFHNKNLGLAINEGKVYPVDNSDYKAFALLVGNMSSKPTSDEIS